jgi:hypothetical protein
VPIQRETLFSLLTFMGGPEKETASPFFQRHRSRLVPPAGQRSNCGAQVEEINAGPTEGREHGF